jgi:hypothetical protein
MPGRSRGARRLRAWGVASNCTFAPNEPIRDCHRDDHGKWRRWGRRLNRFGMAADRHGALHCAFRAPLATQKLAATQGNLTRAILTAIQSHGIVTGAN